MTAAMLVLEPIIDADFPPEQYACPPGRNTQQAANEVEEWLHRCQTDVVDAELGDYVASIPHAELMLSLARRIVHRRVLHLIRMRLWLRHKYKLRRRKGGAVPLSHLTGTLRAPYGYFGLVPSSARGRCEAWAKAQCLVREPDAGDLHVRFDERDVETGY